MTNRYIEAAWRGPELFERDGSQRQLSRAEVEALYSLGAVASDQDAEAIDRTDAIVPALRGLAEGLSHELEHGTGAVLVRGFPLGDRRLVEVERAFWVLTQQLGTPVSQSAEGERLFHVRDAGYAPTDPRYRGPMSRRRLSFHTDRCDVIAFLCIQPAVEGGETFVVSSVAVREELQRRDPRALEVLSRPFPYLRHTVDRGNARPYCELPVFSEYDGNFAAHFLRVLIDRADRSDEAPSLTDEQWAALDALEAVAEDPALHVSFSLEAGDILLLNNWTTFHRRSEFVDADEPELKRHLLRVWLSMPNSRPIDPCFAEHFGATGAGAVRGGMKPVGTGKESSD